MRSRFLAKVRSWKFGEPLSRSHSSKVSRVYKDVYPEDIGSKLVTDTTVYELHNLRQYNRLLIGCSAVSLLITYGGAYISYLARQDIQGRGHDESAQTANIVLAYIRRWSNLFGAICIISAVLGYGLAKSRVLRTVQSIVVRSGGQRVSISHLSSLPLSSTIKTFEVPLENISSTTGRLDKKPFINVFVKGRYFSYLIDKRGHFPDPYLFDHTVGVERKI